MYLLEDLCRSKTQAKSYDNAQACDRWPTKAHNRVTVMILDEVWLWTAKEAQHHNGPTWLTVR